MTKDIFDRRSFLTRVAAGGSGALFAGSLTRFSGVDAEMPLAEPASKYLFKKGLIYLNTGTLGPCRGETIEESMRAWQELETLPVKFYGKFGAEPLAEKTRSIGARFLGCDLSEVVITKQHHKRNERRSTRTPAQGRRPHTYY